jgi:5-formyltetrahydrofolate cyclo-ligase
MNKPAMRTAMKTVLRGISAGALPERSAATADRLSATPAWKNADCVLTFLSMPREIETSAIIRAARAAGKTVAVPRIEDGDIRFLLMPPDARDLPRDAWGIPVPDPGWQQFDLFRWAHPLVTAPGLAFDRRGNRLGRGKGYYDRFLSAARRQAPAILALGVGFSEQLVDSVPHTGDDQPVDGIVTDTETVIL